MANLLEEIMKRFGRHRESGAVNVHSSEGACHNTRYQFYNPSSARTELWNAEGTQPVGSVQKHISDDGQVSYIVNDPVKGRGNMYRAEDGHSWVYRDGRGGTRVYDDSFREIDSGDDVHG